MARRHNNLKNQSLSSEKLLKGQSTNREELSPYDLNFRVSFEFLDRNQGQTFKQWEELGLLTKMNDTLMNYSNKPIHKQFSDNFKEYGEFPSKSGFTPPKHVAIDVDWSVMHITGKAVLGGFIYGNTFFVVFLDSEHQFYLCEKKHT